MKRLQLIIPISIILILGCAHSYNHPKNIGEMYLKPTLGSCINKGPGYTEEPKWEDQGFFDSP